jgi:hypothetical protein
LRRSGEHKSGDDGLQLLASWIQCASSSR